MQSNYRFDPKEDLSVMELAEILNIPDIGGDIFGKFPQRIQRHFSAQMTFEKALEAKPQAIQPAKAHKVTRRKDK